MAVGCAEYVTLLQFLAKFPSKIWRASKSNTAPHSLSDLGQQRHLLPCFYFIFFGKTSEESISLVVLLCQGVGKAMKNDIVLCSLCLNL